MHIDDALKILAPSLEEYKGCHIIDIHPGAGLWSTKIHDFLKPKSHLLIEPSRDVYQPFLKPLLDAPNSKYKFLETQVFAKGLSSATYKLEPIWNALELPEPDNAQLDRPTSSILVLAGLARIPYRYKGELISLGRSTAEKFLFRYLNSLISRCGLHQKGLVRLLVWVMDTDKFNVLPRSVSGLEDATIRTLDELCDVREVVGSSKFPISRRPPHYDVLSAADVARRMKDANQSIPVHRQNRIFKLAAQALADRETENDHQESRDGVFVDGEAAPSQNVLDEIAMLQVEERRFAFSERKLPTRPTSNSHKRADAAAMVQGRARLDAYVGAASPIPSSLYIDRLVIMEGALNQMERDYAAGTFPLADRPAKAAEMDSLAATLAEGYRPLSRRDRRLAAQSADNIEAARSSPSILAWDRRTVEPLDVGDHEFWPRHCMALLDITPKSTAGRSAAFQQLLVRALFKEDTLPIAEALERIAFGAAEALLPKCEAISDPQRGGRLHLQNLRVRMLTLEMVQELLREWNAWPFQKSRAELWNELSRGGFSAKLDSML